MMIHPHRFFGYTEKNDGWIRNRYPMSSSNQNRHNYYEKLSKGKTLANKDAVSVAHPNFGEFIQAIKDYVSDSSGLFGSGLLAERMFLATDKSRLIIAEKLLKLIMEFQEPKDGSVPLKKYLNFVNLCMKIAKDEELIFGKEKQGIPDSKFRHTMKKCAEQAFYELGRQIGLHLGTTFFEKAKDLSISASQMWESLKDYGALPLEFSTLLEKLSQSYRAMIINGTEIIQTDIAKVRLCSKKLAAIATEHNTLISKIFEATSRTPNPLKLYDLNQVKLEFGQKGHDIINALIKKEDFGWSTTKKQKQSKLLDALGDYSLLVGQADTKLNKAHTNLLVVPNFVAGPNRKTQNIKIKTAFTSARRSKAFVPNTLGKSYIELDQLGPQQNESKNPIIRAFGGHKPAVNDSSSNDVPQLMMEGHERKQTVVNNDPVYTVQ
ncbi:hypothetical protein [Piscirickettsia litoralis]|nr:hypothetical protein [Piscirickettsia litoralis]